MQRVEPDYDFLNNRCGISNREELMTALQQMVAVTDLQLKKRDFEHLLFEPRKSEMIIQFLNIIAAK